MRVINDKKEDTESTQVDLLSLLTQALLISMGVATVIFSPLTMLSAHAKFNNQWPKIAAIGGALLALLFLEASLPQVLIGFVFGIYVADGVSREVDFSRLLSSSVAVAFGMALFCLSGAAYLEKANIGPFWIEMVDKFLLQLRGSSALEKNIDWDMLRALILYEGPFLYLSAALMAVWVSVGVAAHFGWLKDNRVFSGEALRNLKISRPLSLSFIPLFVLSLLIHSEFQYLISGVFRLVSSYMFIQGCICLSIILQPKPLKAGFKTAIYVCAVLLGFYAVVGMGVIAPWFLRNRKAALSLDASQKLEEQQT